MNKSFAILYFVVALIVVVSTFPDGGPAVLLLIVGGLIGNAIIRSTSENTAFLQKVFMVGLLVRVSLGTIIHIFDLRDVMGPDAFTYDALASRLVDIWDGNIYIFDDELSKAALKTSGAGWGMKFFVAFIYSITGKNILAAQFCCAVIGAAIAPLIYHCAYKVFNNINVAKRAAWFAALYPAFVLWTCQLLKDGIVIFLLVLLMLSVMVLLEKFSLKFISLLIFCLFALIALRFYVAYIALMATVGSFVIGNSNSIQSILKRIVAIVVIASGLIYLGGVQ